MEKRVLVEYEHYLPLPISWFEKFGFHLELRRAFGLRLHCPRWEKSISLIYRTESHEEFTIVHSVELKLVCTKYVKG
mgnify:CR=1 FL=1